MNPEDEYYSDEDIENMPHENCPQCGRTYDDIDFDYQICSKCGWDNDTEEYNQDACREPDEHDFLSGDATFMEGWV